MPEPIRVTIDPDLAELIPDFLAHRRRELDDLRAAFAAGDFSAIREIGHQIKGTGGGFGFMALTDLGRDLEAAAKLEDAQGVEETVGRLTDYLERVEVIYEG